MRSKQSLAIVLACVSCVTCACSGGDDDKNNSGADIVENTSDLCSDNLDNDGNGLKDCDDPGCIDFAFCQQTEDGKENTLAACMDEEDNDGDGKIDCDDSECKAFAICQEGEEENTLARCQDGKDNDKDGKIDCDDSECKAFSVCSGGSASGDKIAENSVETCIDGEDNDGDGKIDCEDEGCRVFAFCASYSGGTATSKENTEAACTDGVDNDKDGKLDCLDDECRQFELCAPLVGVTENTFELCTDGIDNDYNGVMDDKDPNCKLFTMSGGEFGENSVEMCGDGVDNDGDGVMDCKDPECAVYDICMDGYNIKDDKCPDDPYKFKADSCECGQTLVDGECYINIRYASDLNRMTNSSEKFILKQNIDVGTTTQAPIEGFKGVLEGNNKRISGLFNQDGPVCGLFGSAAAKGTLKIRNLDLAITLNCDCSKSPNDMQNIYVGGLAGSFEGQATNITGSSKVYVQEAVGNLTTLTEVLNKYIGGLFGYATDSEITDITLRGNVSAYLPNYNIDHTSSKYYQVYVGGVAGRIKALTFKNINVNNYVTLYRDTSSCITGSSYAYSYVGGVAGACISDTAVENVHNQGTVLYSPLRTDSYWRLSAIGGLFGYSRKVKDSSFTGIIKTSSRRLENVDLESSYSGSNIINKGANIGGITGYMYAENSYIDHCKVDAEINAVPVNSAIGGIVGNLNASLYNLYIRNCTANIDLKLTYTQGTVGYGYYGGIVGWTKWNSTYFSDKIGYIINNSARTRYILTEENLSNMDNKYKHFGGIVGEGGVVVNNFTSDSFVCGDDACSYNGYVPSAIGGSYVYESYWNREATGSSSGAMVFSDASSEYYNYNADGVPVTRASDGVLGLLRYNSGHAGGVLSAHIPGKDEVTYYDWTTVIDNEGHVIPVPADK